MLGVVCEIGQGGVGWESEPELRVDFETSTRLFAMSDVNQILMLLSELVFEIAAVLSG
jgi:hypothetical protein